MQHEEYIQTPVRKQETSPELLYVNTWIWYEVWSVHTSYEPTSYNQLPIYCWL